MGVSKHMNRALVFLDKLHFAWLAVGAISSLLVFAGGFYWAGFHGQGLQPTYSTTVARVSYGDCLYFSVVTFSSLGYGDLRPVGISRLLSSSEVMIGLAFLGIAIAKLSSARQSYYTARLFSSDAQERLDKFSIGFNDLAIQLQTADSKDILPIVENANHRCVALLNYVKFEVKNGPFLDDVPVRAVRRVLRYLLVLLKRISEAKPSDGSHLLPDTKPGRKLLRNSLLLAELIERTTRHPHLSRDCSLLKRWAGERRPVGTV